MIDLDDLFLAMAKLMPGTSDQAKVETVAARYKQVRTAWIEANTPERNGKRLPSTAARKWMDLVWRSSSFRNFVKAREHVTQEDLIDWEFTAFRTSLLAQMATLTPDSPAKDISRATGTYRRYRTEYQHACGLFGRAGQCQRHLKALYQTPAWSSYQKVRTAATRRLDTWKGKNREQARTWYATKGKAHRATPEVRAKLNAQRRERYAKAKAMAERSPLEDV